MLFKEKIKTFKIYGLKQYLLTVNYLIKVKEKFKLLLILCVYVRGTSMDRYQCIFENKGVRYVYALNLTYGYVVVVNVMGNDKT